MITRNGLDIGQVVSSVKNDFLNTLIRGTSFPAENILHQYRTFNYRVTLALVSEEERKSQSYKVNGFDYIIFQSHGKNADGVMTPGGSQTLNKIQSLVNTMTAGGKNAYNFYLDDLYIKSFVGGGRDWATDIKIKVVEPYSIDTFLTTLLNGIAIKGHKSFDKSVPFVLKIDFVGYRDNSDQPEIVPYSTRYYPISIVTMNANLTTQGTVYEITAAARNDLAKMDDSNIVSEPLKLTGKTVGDIMQSLENTLNGLGKSKKEDSNISSHIYSIKFLNDKNEEVPANLSSDVITSVIKATKMFDSQEDSGVKNFLKDKSKYTSTKTVTKTENAEDAEVTLTVDGRLGITTIIDGLICDSYFVVDRLKNEFKGYYDQDGQLPWWRVTASIENGEWIASQNTYQKIITFKIIPRKVHYSKLTSTFKPSHVAPASDYNSMVARVYEWNYTGNNRDVISLNLNFNQLWYKLISGNYGKKTETQGANKESRTQESIVLKNPDGTSLKSTSTIGLKMNTNPVGLTATSTLFAPSLNSSNANGQVRTSAETNPLFDLARDVNAIINNPYEQISLNMEILGDPMWLGTQFIDDNSVVGNGSSLFTVDGGIAIRTVDPIIRVLAYSPKDINEQGFIAPAAGESRSMSKYSAHYTINEIESYFQNGVFKQRIKGNRNTNQDLSVLAAEGNSGDRFGWNKIDLSIR